MTLSELKENILTDSLPDSFLILVCEENHFLAKQYLNELADRAKKELVPISSLRDCLSSPVRNLFSRDDKLNVLEVETFDELLADYSKCDNIIVICDKLDKKVEKVVEEYVVKISKIPEWAVKDYMQMLCTGLDTDDIDWLYAITKGDIYKITNELSKLITFSEAERHTAFGQLKDDPNTDMYRFELFDFTGAVLTQQRMLLYNWLIRDKAEQLVPMAAVSTLLQNYRDLLFARYSPGKTLKEMGYSGGIYRSIDKCPRYTMDELRAKIKFLSEIDTRLKNNELALSNKDFFNYLIVNLLDH